jgi:predicted PurR-regulated permease PerM
MNRIFSWLQTIKFSRIITVFLVTIAFLVTPAFIYNQSFQAQAETLIAQSDSYTVDSKTVKRIQEKAEDLGDRSEKRGGRAIGDTGLKNIKNLGENIPETLEMRAKQDTKDALNGDQKKALDDAQNRAGGVIDSAKQAIKNVID